MNLSKIKEDVQDLHNDPNSELGLITLEILENLELSKCQNVSEQEVLQAIRKIYMDIRSSLFFNFYDLGITYWHDDTLNLPAKYLEKITGTSKKIRIREMKFDSNEIKIFNKLSRDLINVITIFDNPTNGINENNIIRACMSGVSGSANTNDLDEATKTYFENDWMKSKKLEKLLIKIYSAFNFLAAWQKESDTKSIFILKTIGIIFFEVSFFVANLLVSNYLSNNKLEYIPLIFTSIYALRFYNPLTIKFRKQSYKNDKNLRSLAKVHNKIMSDDYFCSELIKYDFTRLEHKNLNISRYVFKLINESKS